MRPLLAALVLFGSAGAFADDEHPLESYFTSEVLEDEDAKKVKTSFEISDRLPYSLEMEVYHTDLEKELVGAIIEVKAEAIDLTYELLIQITAPPYTRVSGEAPLFRGKDLIGADPVFTIRQFRYEELPEVDDPSEDDDSSDDN